MHPHIMFVNLFLFFLRCQQTVASTGDFEENSITYNYDTGNKITWYDTYKNCRAAGKYSVEFHDDVDWSNYEDDLPNDEVWLGLIFIGNQGWWSSGRAYGGDTSSSSLWKGDKPSAKTSDNPECVRVEKGGQKKWELKDCDDADAYLFCQDYRIASSEPFLAGSVYAVIFTEEQRHSHGSQTCTEIGYSLATILDAVTNQAIYDELNKFSSDETDLYYIGLQINGGSLLQITWEDGSSLASVGFDAMKDLPSDVGDPCVKFDRTLSVSGSWEKTGCSDLYGSICTRDSDEWVPFRDQYYIAVDGDKTFDEAEDSCENIGGFLAFVTDPGVQAFVETLIHNKGNVLSSSPTFWWIGGRNYPPWEWLNGDVILYVHPHQTSDTGTCLGIDRTNGYIWRKLNCSTQAAFLCQSTYAEPTVAVATTMEETTTVVHTTAPETTTVVDTTVPETTTVVHTTVPDTTTILDTTFPETTTILVTTVPETTTILDTTVPETTTILDTIATETTTILDTIATDTVAVQTNTQMETSESTPTQNTTTTIAATLQSNLTNFVTGVVNSTVLAESASISVTPTQGTTPTETLIAQVTEVTTETPSPTASPYAAVTQIVPISQQVTNRDRSFNISLSSHTLPACFMFDYGDEKSVLVQRDDSTCEQRFTASQQLDIPANQDHIIVDHRYSWTGGTFSIVVSYYNGTVVVQSTISITISIATEPEPHAVVTSLVNDATSTSTVSITALFDDADSRICGFVVFNESIDDVIVVRHYDVADCRMLFADYGDVYGVIQTVDDFVPNVTVEHTYTLDETYNIHVYFYNGSHSVLSTTSFTAVLDECTADFRIITKDPNVTTTIFKSESLTISSYFTVQCPRRDMSSSNFTYAFRWSSQSCVTDNDVTHYPQFTGVTARFASQSLPYGCQIIRVTMTMRSVAGNSELEYSDELSVEVVRSPLVASLLGGASRTIGRAEAAVIDAESVSYDPDTGSNQNLTFVFAYQLLPWGPWHALGNTSSMSQEPVFLQGNRLGVLRFELPSNDVGNDVTVAVEAGAADGRTAMFVQRLTLVDLPPPDVTINCEVNCESSVVNPHLLMLLRVEFLSQGEDGTTYGYLWKVKEIENDTQREMDVSRISPSDRQELYIPPDLFSPNTRYLTSCEVTNMQTGAKASVSFDVATDQLPYGGNCSVSPTSGTAAVTNFLFSCFNWSLESVLHLPPVSLLTYSFYFGRGQDRTLLAYSDSGETAPIVLPAGEPANDHRLEIEVEVCKRKLLCYSFPMFVQVFTSTSQDIATVVQEISVLESTNNVASLNQLANAVLIKPQSESENETESIEVRSKLVSAVDSLLESNPSDVNDIQQLSSVMSLATASLGDDTIDMTSQGSSVVSVLGQRMEQLVEETVVPQAVVEEVAKKLVEAMSNIMLSVEVNVSAEADILLRPKFEQYKPMPDDANDLSPREVLYAQQQEAEIQRMSNAQHNSERRGVVTNVMTASDHVTSGMSMARLSNTGRMVASVHDRAMGVSVLTVAPGSEAGSTNSTDGSHVTLESSGDVTARVEFLQNNPFHFDSTSLLVDSPVLRFQADVKKPTSSQLVAVTLKNKDDATPISLRMREGQLSTSRFEVHSAADSVLIYLTPKNPQSEIKVFIRYKTQPLLMDYTSNPDVTRDVADYTFTLPLEGQFKVFISDEETKGPGVYFIATEWKSTSDRKKRSAGNVTELVILKVFTSSCKVHDPVSGSWSNNHCKTSNKSTAQSTVCDCVALPNGAPLTVGAQFFVAPNTIDFSTVFSKVDVIGNGAVLWTLVSLVILCCLFLLWLRRKDKQDLEKWTTKVMTDNLPRDHYYYKVSFVTGISSNAGTTSQVSFVVTGEQGQTKTRRANDESGKHWFTSGSTVHWLMSTSRCLGNLEYVQVWHDNSGRDRNASNWFLSEIIVQDLHTDKIFVFPCSKWLAVEKGDGFIDRLLPVAGDDNLSAYKRIFQNTARQKLTDGHLLFSVFSNHSKSNFTRCQRLGCVMALLFLAMIANAMFYRSNSDIENREQPALLKLGPIEFDPKVVWISIATMLIVTPPSLLLVHIFRSTRNTRVAARVSSLSSLSSENTFSRETSQNGGWTLPYWFVYVGWSIVVSCILASGFFTCLYSFQWGKDKSEAWLSSLILSFTEDSLLIQPLKVVILAGVLALICRKKTDPMEEWKATTNDVIVTPPTSAVGTRSHLPGDAFEVTGFGESQNEVVKAPPRAKDIELEKIRFRRKVEKRAVKYVISFTLYVLYVALLFFIAYQGHQDYNFFRKTAQLKRELKIDNFEDIKTAEDLWSYLKDDLLPAVYPTVKYNGENMTWRDRIFIQDQINYRLGPVRIRQTRRRPVPCDSYEVISKTSPNVTKLRPCYRGDDFFGEDTRNYAPRWREWNGSGVNGLYWEFAAASVTKAMPILGRMSWYGGSGYLADLGVRISRARTILDYLKSELWIDRSTRVVITRFTLYNVNSKIFSSVDLLCEFLLTGGITTTGIVKPFRLYPTENATAIFATTVVAGIFAMYQFFCTVKKLVIKKKAFFKNVWNTLASVRIFLILSFVLMTVYEYNLQENLLNTFQEDTYAFTDFQTLSSVTGWLREMLAFIIFIESIKVLEFVKSHKHLRKVGAMFHSGQKVVFDTLLHALMTFFAYTMVAILLFSSQLKSYKNFEFTLQTLFSVLLGTSTYEEINNTTRIVGKIFFFCFSVHMIFLILNLLVGMVDVLLRSTKLCNRHHDIQQRYFRIVFRMAGNLCRRVLNQQEVSSEEFFEDLDEEDLQDDGVSSDEEDNNDPSDGEVCTTRAQHMRKRLRTKRRKNKNKQVSFDVHDLSKFDEKQAYALGRLKRLEEAVDSIEITIDADDALPGGAKRGQIHLMEAIEEVDAIFETIRDDLKQL